MRENDVMPGSYEVQPDDLVAHASHLDGLVDRLDSAMQAADYAMSDDAYGLLCSFLPPIITPTGEKAKESLSASSEGVQTLSDNVRKAADGYREAEESSKEPLEKKRSVLEGMDVTPAMHGVKANGSESTPAKQGVTPRTHGTVPQETPDD